MKILFVATEYMEKGIPTTGFPNYLYRVSLALIEMGHIPMIIASGERDSHRVEEGIEIWTVRTTVKYYKIFRGEIFVHLKMSYMLNRKIKEIIAQRQVDIIQFTSIGGMALFYYGRVPAVMRLSSYAKTYFASLQTYDERTLYFKALLERLSARRCDALFAPCRVTAEAFGRDCRRKVSVIETPFINDVMVMDNHYVEEYLADKKYVLFFGTFYPEKGILVIAEILREFLAKNEGYYFVFIGEVRKIDGVDTRKIIKKAAGEFSDRVIIWSALLHKELYPVIKHADFVVLPSLMDNLPNTCIEAMFFSKIVVGTNGASFEQLIQSGENGLLCKIGDSRDLFMKMQTVVELDNAVKRNMERKAHYATLRLQPKCAVKKLLKYYEYVLEKKKEV